MPIKSLPSSFKKYEWIDHSEQVTAEKIPNELMLAVRFKAQWCVMNLQLDKPLPPDTDPMEKKRKAT